MNFARIFRDYALLWAMLLGILFHPWLWKWAPLTTYTLFLMLLLSYTKIKPTDIKFTRTHLLMFAIQWIAAMLSYFIIEPYDHTVAIGVALLILTPTATAAPVITSMLGGSIAFVTTYLIVSNVAIALIGPVLIGLVYPEMQMGYWDTVLTILSQVSMLLVLPLGIAWGLRYTVPKIHDKLSNLSFLTFWMWVLNIMILIGAAVHTYLTSEQLTPRYTLLLLLITLATTLGLYYLGGRSAKWTGAIIVNGRQTLGQKNTVFSIWLAMTFLDPEIAFFPTLYIVIQNVINSLELAAHQRAKHKYKEC
ncbi:MAG: hypothetical protein Q4E10_04225 [Porphyromonas sp.]|nr:hypothetical protein [Porphyromonas sp.]